MKTRNPQISQTTKIVREGEETALVIEIDVRRLSLCNLRTTSSQEKLWIS